MDQAPRGFPDFHEGESPQPDEMRAMWEAGQRAARGWLDGSEGESEIGSTGTQSRTNPDDWCLVIITAQSGESGEEDHYSGHEIYMDDTGLFLDKDGGLEFVYDGTEAGALVETNGNTAVPADATTGAKVWARRGGWGGTWLFTYCCGPSTTVATASAITTSQHNYVIPTTSGVPAETVRLPVNADVSLTGLVRTIVSQRVTLVNVGTSTLTVANQSSSSTAANRIITPTGGDLAVLPGMTVELAYDETTGRWRIVTGTATSYDDTPATATFSTDQDDYDLTTSTGGPAPAQLWDITSAVTFTGVSAPASVTTFTVVNTGDSVAYFAHQDGSSSANNQFTLPGDVTLAVPPGATATFVKGPDGKWWPSAGTGVSAPGTIALQPTTPPPTPSAGSAMYVDSADGALKAKNSAGVVSLLDSSAAARTEGTLAAAGSSQGDAAAITTDSVEVTGADGAKGVILPSTAGAIIAVWNNHASNSLNIYPPSGARLSTLSTDQALSAVGASVYVFARLTSTQWTYWSANSGP